MNGFSDGARIDAEITSTVVGSDPFAAAVRATRMPMVITDPRLPDNPIVYVNDAFVRLTGYAREEIIGRNCRFLQGPETSLKDVARVRDAIERRVTIEIDLKNRRKDGTVFWNRLLVSPVFASDGELTYFFASQYDVTLEKERLVILQRDRDALEAESARRSLELIQSEERLRFTLKAGRLGAWTLDLGVMRLISSDGLRENLGRSPHAPLSYEEMIAAIHPDDRHRKLAARDAAIAGHSDYDIEIRIITPRGEIRWLQFRGRASYRADGTPLSIAGISLDITDRKRAEEHRDLLAGELNHRIQNTLATVQSIARQTLRGAASLEEAQVAMESRLQSLSAATEMLARGSGDWATLTEVVIAALHPFGVEQDQRFKIGGPILRLAPRIALAFALAIHELATNSVKYGSLSVDDGRVIVSWDVVDGSSPDRLWFQWQEVGGPRVSRPTRTGFGSRMIERALAQEIGGTAEIDYRPRGVVFTAEAPLPEITRD
ncbi:PAS domain S-box protein [Methylobacterium brachiatum]|uniref:PAS domain S-box protein n=1 Tax=Methylobacterium brachiatum TaxID=269660 RepID=UPI0002699D78|nr:PAS domain S-box protein [Methylobacterium brachiatum]EIZ81442.1 signal transduction histidine kinase [Methylobacterium sp. GXF4]MDH2309456.1 PAS domain S-box protein [Methylobacterium brachiatum]SFH92204.1 PAS domain S-box-containing protein [Methylobacterium brachiatum]